MSTERIQSMKGTYSFRGARRAANLSTDLRNMADNCEFRDLRDSLIRDRIVFRVTDNHVKKRLLRVPDLTLERIALEGIQ